MRLVSFPIQEVVRGHGLVYHFREGEGTSPFPYQRIPPVHVVLCLILAIACILLPDNTRGAALPVRGIRFSCILCKAGSPGSPRVFQHQESLLAK
jgi:hypothetical protein